MNYAMYMNRNKSKLRDGINNKASLIVASILYIIILLRDASIISINPIVLTSICVITFPFFTINNITKILLFLLPFAGGVFLNSITLIAFICISAKVILSGKINPKLVYCLLIGFFIGFYNIMIDNVNQDIRIAIQLAIYIGIVSIFVYYSDTLQVESVLKYFIAGTLLSVINTIYITLTNYSLSHIITYGVRFGSVSGNISTVTSYDSNTMGMFCIIAIALVYVLNKTKHIKVSYSNILIILLILLGALTISRTYFLLCVLLMSYIFIKNTNRKGIFNLLIFALFSIGIYIIFIKNSTIYRYVIQQYGNRFFESNVYSMGDRTSIFSHYMNVYSKSIILVFFGSGINGYKTLNNGISTHNGFQEVFLSWGMVGLIIIFTWIAMIIKEASRDRNKDLAMDAYIPLIFFAIYIQTLQWFSVYIYILLMAVLLLAIKLKTKKEVE